MKYHLRSRAVPYQHGQQHGVHRSISWSRGKTLTALIWSTYLELVWEKWLTQMRARDNFWSKFSKLFLPKQDYEALAIKYSPTFSKCFIKELWGEEVWKNCLILVPVELIFWDSASELCSRHTLTEVYETDGWTLLVFVVQTLKM